MANIRGLLLAVIAVFSGAWLGLDLLKSGAKKAARTVTTPPVEPVRLGAEAGAIALPWQKRGAPPLGSRGKTLSPDKPKGVPGTQDTRGDIRQIHGPIGYVMELFKRFGADHCPAWAAALSFFSILSIPPVLLCGLAVLGFVIRSPQQATQTVEQALTSVLPGTVRTKTAQAKQIVRDLNIEKSAQTLRERRGVAGFIGIASLFWAAMQIFINATTPVNAAFRTEETRGWFKLRGYALGLLLGAGLLFLLSLLPSSGPAMLRSIPFLNNLEFPLRPLVALLFVLIGVAINATMFTLIYRFLPSPSSGVDWKEAAFAGAIVAVLWESAKLAFAFYLQKFAGYDKMYGSLGGLIALVFWIYYTSMILLLGAEIAKLYSDAREAKA